MRFLLRQFSASICKQWRLLSVVKSPNPNAAILDINFNSSGSSTTSTAIPKVTIYFTLINRNNEKLFIDKGIPDT